MKTSRRRFLKITGSGAIAATVPIMAKTASGDNYNDSAPVSFRMGIASYSLRKFEVNQVLEMTKRLGISAITFKSMHLPLDSSKDRIEEVSSMFRKEGIDVYGGGVIYMKDRQEVDQAFEYARMAGMKIIVGVPEHNLLSYVEKKVKKYDILLAIHNHGPEDEKYPGPSSAYKRVENLDPRMGLCIDIGHTARLGLDPASEIRKFFPRVFDIHMKDVSAAVSEGKTCVMGLGVIDIPEMIKVLVQNKYAYTLALEYEAEAQDPLAGMARSFGYVQGVGAAMGYRIV